MAVSPAVIGLRRADVLRAAFLLAVQAPPATVLAVDDPLRTAPLRPPSASSAWESRTPAPPCATDPAPADPLSLAAAIDLALCRHPKTRESWSAAKVAAAQLGVSRAATLPTVTGTLGAQASETRNALNAGRRDQANGTLSFNYLLLDGGGRDAAIEQSRQALLAADWSHNVAIKTVILEAGQAFFQLFAAEEAVTAARAAESFASQSLEAARARQKAGTATRADVLQSQTAHSQAILTRTQSEGDAAVARGILATALGMPAPTPLRLAPPRDLDPTAPAETAVAGLVQTALEARPELRAADANLAAARAAVTVEQSAGKPTVSLFANASAAAVSPGADPRSGAVGVTVTIPLFLGYQTTYRVLSARENAERTSAVRERLRNDISLEVWRAFQDMRSQAQALLTTNDLVASATESYEVALGRYRAGVGTVIDLLTAQTALVQAGFQKIQARLRWNVSRVALARAIGALEPALFGDTAPAGPTPRAPR